MASLPHGVMSHMLVLAAAFLSSCAQQQTTTNVIRLPSGEQISFLDVHGDAFIHVNQRQRHIYYVGYQSSHDMSQTAALRIEARRVFALYLPQIIDAGYDTCVVTPEQKTAGGDLEGRPYYFSRQANGQWTTTP